MDKKTAKAHLRLIGFKQSLREEDIYIRDSDSYRIIFSQLENKWICSLFSADKDAVKKIAGILNGLKNS